MDKKAKNGIPFFKRIGAVGTLRVVLSVTIILVLLVVMYAHVSNVEPKKNENETVVSKVDEIISRDIVNNYPTTVRELVTLFTEIQMCYYNEDINEEELKCLADKARLLFDEDLLAQNPYETYYDNLKQEISDYKKINKKISRVLVDKASDVNVVPMPDGDKAASIKVTYYCKEMEGTTKTVETYILRKDDGDRWKIYGWGIIDDK